MDLAIHNDILWQGCVLAERRLRNQNPIGDPRLFFPYLVRGSWMNDTNQVSPLLDLNTRVDVDANQRVLFHGLWKLSLEDLFVRISSFADGGVLMPHAPKIMAGDQNVEGFGVYEPLDHLDVLKDIPPNEHDASWTTPVRGGRARTVHNAVMFHIPTRLTDSTVGKSKEVRLDLQRLSILGRGLHSVADFFAHSNYVELLLWSLVWRNALDPNLVDAFNFDNGSDDVGGLLFRCPLPVPGPVSGRNLRRAQLWYHDEPASTALTSAVFDMKDTTYSLLHIYAAHLKRADGEPQTDSMLDLAMAVFDVQGAALIKGAWKLFSAIGEVFRSVGQAARRKLAEGLYELANSQPDERVREAAQQAAGLVRTYDSKEAGEWAQAGRISYLERQLQLDMAQPLVDQTPRAPRLSHHSLIAKDHVNDEGGGVLRFKLACMLATEVTADLLEWHFSRTPAPDRFVQIRERVMIHPWRIVDSQGFDVAGLAARIHAIDGSARWQRLALLGPSVLGATP